MDDRQKPNKKKRRSISYYTNNNVYNSFTALCQKSPYNLFVDNVAGIQRNNADTDYQLVRYEERENLN